MATPQSNATTVHLSAADSTTNHKPIASTTSIVLAAVGVVALLLTIMIALGMVWYSGRWKVGQAGGEASARVVLSKEEEEQRRLDEIVAGMNSSSSIPDSPRSIPTIPTTFRATPLHPNVNGNTSATFAPHTLRFSIPPPLISSSSDGSNSSGPIPDTSDSEPDTHHSIRRPDLDITRRNAPAVKPIRPISCESARRVGRIAVPSMLIRELGDLPQLPCAKRDSTLLPSTRPESESHTPVLDLGISAADATVGKLEDDLDFEIEKSMWLSCTLSTALESGAINPGRDLDQAKPPIPSAPVPRRSTSIRTRRRSPSSSAKASSSSQTDGQSIYASAPSVPQSLTASQTSVRRPTQAAPPKVSDIRSSSFRPLSLGLALGSGSQTSLGTALRNARISLWGGQVSGTAFDLEACNASATSHSLSDSSNDPVSSSIDREAETTALTSDSSFGNTTSLSANGRRKSVASVPRTSAVAAAKPTVVSLRLQGQEEETTTSRSSIASSTSTDADSLDEVPLVTVAQMQAAKRAQPTRAVFTRSPAPDHARQMGGACLPPSTGSKSSAPFVSSFHKAMYPDAPLIADHSQLLSPQLASGSGTPALGALTTPTLGAGGREGPFVGKGASPKVSSPRPSFTEGVRARLSITLGRNSANKRDKTGMTPTLGSPSVLQVSCSPAMSPVLSRSPRSTPNNDVRPIDVWRVSTDGPADFDETAFLPRASGQVQFRNALRAAGAGVGLGLGFGEDSSAEKLCTTQELNVESESLHGNTVTAATRDSAVIALEQQQDGSTLRPHSRVHFASTTVARPVDLGVCSPLDTIQTCLTTEAQRMGAQPQCSASMVCLASPASVTLPSRPSELIRTLEAGTLGTPRSRASLRYSQQVGIGGGAVGSPLSDFEARLDRLSVGSSLVSDGVEDAVTRRQKLLESVWTHRAKLEQGSKRGLVPSAAAATGLSPRSTVTPSASPSPLPSPLPSPSQAMQRDASAASLRRPTQSSHLRPLSLVASIGGGDSSPLGRLDRSRKRSMTSSPAGAGVCASSSAGSSLSTSSSASSSSSWTEDRDRRQQVTRRPSGGILPTIAHDSLTSLPTNRRVRATSPRFVVR